jgi:hypothetical protein
MKVMFVEIVVILRYQSYLIKGDASHQNAHQMEL